jgi:hypothetical protein
MRTVACAAVMLIAVAVSAPFAATVFAQAGSTGGTLGNTDKSISGERREEPATPKSQTHRSASAPAANKSKSSGCGNAVGTYKYPLGRVAVFKADGTTTISPFEDQGTWTCANGQVTVVWKSGYTDHLTPTPGGFSVVNNTGTQFEVARM